jgi:hypothetical protein
VEDVGSPAEIESSWLERHFRRLVIGTIAGGATGWILAALLAQLARRVWADSFGLTADDTGLYHGREAISVFSGLLLVVGALTAIFVRRQAVLGVVAVCVIAVLGVGSVLWARHLGHRAAEGRVVATYLGPTHLTSLRLVTVGLSDGTLIGEGEDSAARYRLVKLRVDDEVIVYDLKDRRARSYPWSTVSLLAWLAKDGDVQTVGNPCAAIDEGAVHPDWNRSPEEMCRELQRRN